MGCVLLSLRCELVCAGETGIRGRVRSGAFPDDGQFSFNITDSGRLTARNMDCLESDPTGLRLRDSQITGGPAWIRTVGFDVMAQPGQVAPVERSRVLEMLQVCWRTGSSSVGMRRFAKPPVMRFGWHPEDQSSHLRKTAQGEGSLGISQRR